MADHRPYNCKRRRENEGAFMIPRTCPVCMLRPCPRTPELVTQTTPRDEARIRTNVASYLAALNNFNEANHKARVAKAAMVRTMEDLLAAGGVEESLRLTRD